MKAARADRLLFLCVGGVIGGYDVLYVLFTLFGGPVIGPTTNALFPDFLVFDAAVRAWIEGKAALIYDAVAFTAYQNGIFAGRLEAPDQYRPFFYPPIWLLMLLPLAALGVIKAYGVFMGVTAGLATLANRRDLWGWLAVLISPAAVWVVIAGQNTFLSVALLYGGLRLLDRSPAVAGILLGLLAYKPQLWLLVPVGLLAARHWRALIWMSGTIVVVSIASLGLFGAGTWQAFFVSAHDGASAHGAALMFDNFRNQIVTLFAAARIVGLPPAIADLLQLAGAVMAVALVWRGFRRHGSREARTALLATATFFVGPYTMNYDMLLLMPAAVSLFRRGMAEGFYPGERPLHLLLWLTPTLVIALNKASVPIAPLVILLFGVVAWARLQGTPKVELPEPAAAR